MHDEEKFLFDVLLARLRCQEYRCGYRDEICTSHKLSPDHFSFVTVESEYNSLAVKESASKNKKKKKKIRGSAVPFFMRSIAILFLKKRKKND